MRRSAPYSLLLLVAVGVSISPRGLAAAPAPIHYAGWAVEAYPDQSEAQMEAMVRRLVTHGANVVWIGHNNPGEVDPDKGEPGLSYAVYDAYTDTAHPGHETAAAMVAATHRLLTACRAAGVGAVLPVGYQIQMGRAWNAENPAALRRDAAGQPLDIYGGGVSASFFAPQYRRDITDYYRWVDGEFVRPYADVLLMLNLADEPIGGDYSPAAEQEFRRRHGFGFGEARTDPARQQSLGRFQAEYVVEYATFSAELWDQIHPGLPVTMSFDGGQARLAFTLPDVEALFRDTPPNFVVTLDAYPHDGLPQVPTTDADLTGLYLLARSLGLYSARYRKPLWLWAAANSWGLSQASPDPGTVSDAIANGLALSMLVRQGGGDLEGLVYWNYNVKGQGLYNDLHATSYDVETMFAEVSALLPSLRARMAAPAGQPDVLILSPPAAAHRQIGMAGVAVRLEEQPFPRLGILARTGVSAAVVGSLEGWSLGEMQTIVVLSAEADALAEADLRLLRSFLAAGGKVVASPGVDEALADAVSAPPAMAYDGLVQQAANLYVAQNGVPVLFEDSRHELLAGFWREVLGLDHLQPGYRIVTDETLFVYHLGPEPVTLQVWPSWESIGHHYADCGRPMEAIHSPGGKITLGRREFLLLRRVPWLDLRV